MPLETLERRAIFRALQETSGDKLAAACLLGIGKTTLYRKLKQYESGRVQVYGPMHDSRRIFQANPKLCGHIFSVSAKIIRVHFFSSLVPNNSGIISESNNHLREKK